MKTLPQKLLLGLATLALLAASLGLSDGDRALARKVNEYEGQHRVAGDPSQWG